MDIVPRLESLFTNYLEQADTLKSDKNRFASVLGWLFGSHCGPGDKDLNPEFYDAVSACLKEFQSEPFAPEDAVAVVTFVLRISADNAENPVAKWTMVGVQGLLTPLVPSLPPENAVELADWYKKQYPRHKRFPVQEDLLKALKARI